MSIWCYSDQLSFRAGDKVTFYVSSSVATVSLEISRWGAEIITVYRRENLQARYLPIPENASTHGCGWTPTFSFTVPADWRSGYYRVLVRNGNGDECEHFFVVRSSQPGKQNKILLQLATNTYQAYNAWGGSCLYGGSQGVVNQVSFQRPFQPGLLTPPAGAPRIARLDRAGIGFNGAVRNPALAWTNATEPENRWVSSAGYGRWEQRFVAWAEHNGFELDYAINSDLERFPEILENYRLLLSVGHDEYWSWGMRDTLESFIANGGNVAFFSGNTCFWQVRWQDGGETMVCYKYQCQEDPILGSEDERFLTSIWSDHIVGRPENALTGVSFTRGGYARFGGAVPRGSGGYTVWRPEHWSFDGTGLEYGDLLGAEQTLVGYECDGCEMQLENGLPVPTHNDATPESFIILASSPATLAERIEAYGNDGYLGDEDLTFCAERVYGKANAETKAKLAHGNAVMGLYKQGGTVFTTGCTEWAYGLQGENPYVEQITHNILTELAKAIPEK